MNLVGSHDTARILWLLTPGSFSSADKELNAANLAVGKQRVELASLIQFTLPGAPTIYYGDEVGLTGADDPDDRRTYPWADLGGAPDQSMFTHYQTLAALRRNNPVLTAGDLRMLFADDAAGVVAYGRKTTQQAALVVLNRSDQDQTVTIPVAGYLPDGVVLNTRYVAANAAPVAASAVVTNGSVSITAPAHSGWLLTSGLVDLLPPAAPTGLQVTAEGNAQLGLSWSAVSGAVGYNLYRSPLSGGGWVKLNNSLLTGTTFTDTGLRNTQVYYYVATALDSAGNESAYSNQASGMPRLTIGWANLQWPPTMTHTISATNRTDTAYGQVWIDGVTNQPGVSPGLRAQLGFGPAGSNPDGSPDWAWVDATFNTDAGNNDEFKASMLPESVGTFDYAYRYSTTNGQTGCTPIWTAISVMAMIPASRKVDCQFQRGYNCAGNPHRTECPFRITCCHRACLGCHHWRCIALRIRGFAFRYSRRTLRPDRADYCSGVHRHRCHRRGYLLLCGPRPGSILQSFRKLSRSIRQCGSAFRDPAI